MEWSSITNYLVYAVGMLAILYSLYRTASEMVRGKGQNEHV